MAATSLTEIFAAVQGTGDTTTGNERTKRWLERAVRQVRENVSADEAKRLEGTRLHSFAMGDPVGNLGKLLGKYDAVLSTLVEEIERDPDFLNGPGHSMA